MSLHKRWGHQSSLLLDGPLHRKGVGGDGDVWIDFSGTKLLWS